MIRRKAIKKEKKSNKSISAIDIIYVILYIAWNVFSFYLIYKIAKSENKVFEILIFCGAFIINKTLFGKPLHLRSDICFIASMVIFYILSRCVPKISISIILPVELAITIALVGNVINELIFEEKDLTLREKILKKVDGNFNKGNVYWVCKEKMWTDEKSDYITETVMTYYSHSLQESAILLSCDKKTVTRRINEFIKD